MKLIENILNNIAYYYYPKNLHESDELFLNSIKSKRFLELFNNWSEYEKQLKQLLNTLEEKIDPKFILVNETGRHFPSFEIEILNENNVNKLSVTKIYISFLIPFYHIVNLTGNKKTAVINSGFIIKPMFNQLIEKEMKESFNYIKLPNQLLKNKIPNLIVNEGFNYLNAFFTDGYRINNF